MRRIRARSVSDSLLANSRVNWQALDEKGTGKLSATQFCDSLKNLVLPRSFQPQLQPPETRFTLTYGR